MNWRYEAVARLANANAWTYHPAGPSCTEPAALTVLALIGLDQREAAEKAARWLANIQQSDGAIGVSADQAGPRWPTALSLSAWSCYQEATGCRDFEPNIAAAVKWALSHQGETMERSNLYGHDTTLRGWPWVIGTHAWLEPTCLFVAAMYHCGRANHPRVREGIRVILDRQLPTGGFNYGNTFVMGQQLRAHVQPTGIALSALAVCGVEKRLVTKSLNYLRGKWTKLRATASLCYAAIGMAACNEIPDSLDPRLNESWIRWRDGNHGIHKLALIGLAMQASNCVLLKRSKDIK